MRGFAVVVWCLLPVGALAWHFGPGKDFLASDDAGGALRAADRHAAAGQWDEAVDAYESALASIPADRVGEIQRIQLERAKAKMMSRRLPEAHQELVALVDELQGTKDTKLLNEARSALASAQYYTTWLMRLEGMPPTEWEPEIESARQTYKLLAEQAETAGDQKAAKTHREDLESAIRLYRMDLSELQALALPSQCNGCCNGSCNGRGKGKCNSKGRGPQREGDPSRGAGGEMPPDTRGS